MLLKIFSLILLSITIYFIFRYFSLIYALNKIRREIDDMNQDPTQNQMVHLPLPDQHLRKLLCSINAAFLAIQKERQRYVKREKEFQNQIENISHDLRTPLTVILGYIKIFKKSKTVVNSNDKELMDTLNILEQKAEVMKNLVAQFYDYSRINADDYKLELQNIDVSRTLRESLMGNYQILEQSRLDIDVHIPEHPIWVFGETAALERIFLNLFQNAVRYADTLFQILVKEQPEEAVILFINDTQALEKNDISHLFDRFYIQDQSRSQGATGLGLTVAKYLAEQMNGEMTAYVIENQDSDTDNGNRMKICFELRLKVIAAVKKLT